MRNKQLRQWAISSVIVAVIAVIFYYLTLNDLFNDVAIVVIILLFVAFLIAVVRTAMFGE